MLTALFRVHSLLFINGAVNVSMFYENVINIFRFNFL